MSKGLQKYLFLVLILTSALAGIYIGHITINKFDVLVKGVSGAAILILINLVLFRQKGDPFNRPVELYRDIIYIPIMFIFSLLSHWSIQNLANMFIYYF